MDDTEDDWLFDSIKMYKTLLMFDLHGAASSLAWASDRSVCVSTEGPERHEILELSLPEKILTSNADSEGLCSDRDFRMISGGFSDEAVKGIRLIPNTRTIAVTEKTSNSLSVWKLGDATSDLIEKTAKVENRSYDSKPATLDVKPGQAVFGSKVNDVSVVDVTTCRILCDSHSLVTKDPLGNLFAVDDSVLLACCRDNCQIWRFDQREGLAKGKSFQPRAISGGQELGGWTYDVENSKAGQTGVVVSLGLGGQLMKMDKRNLQTAVSSVQLAGVMKNTEFQENYLTLKICPQNQDTVSVSGVDSSVHVYSWHEMDSGKVIQPTFSHKGHMTCSSSRQSKTLAVTSHMWHPWQPNLVLSSASDGSLHAWQREGSVEPRPR